MAFRKQLPKLPEPTVREMVAKYGDDWRLLFGGTSLPFVRRQHMERTTSDTWEAAHMLKMEQGELDRVPELDLYGANDRPPIHVEHVYPPIPERCCDYAAYRDPEGQVGRGATPFLAINDLIEQESE